jgi:UDP-2-acetamido-2-deoxy-ribo-hexuluronate aminotransferase
MGEHRYHHTRIGINGRLDSIQCAVLIEKLKRYPQEIANRQKVAARYTQAFTELREYGVTPPQTAKDTTSVWAQYTVRVPNRAELQKRLQAEGIPTAIHYPITMADQPAYKEVATTHAIPVARQAADEVMSLPMYPDMSESVQNQIVEIFSRTAKGL